MMLCEALQIKSYIKVLVLYKFVMGSVGLIYGEDNTRGNL